MNKNQINQNVIAIVYDFDGTLTPKPMQEYTILPEIGIDDGAKFWDEVSCESKRTKGEGILTYMRLMLERNATGRIKTVHFGSGQNRPG